MVPFTTEELVAAYKRALNDSAILFSAPADADFLRHLRIAARAISAGKRTRTLPGTLALQADIGEYDAPADLVEVKVGSWGARERNASPWTQPRDPLPTIRTFVSEGTTRKILLQPAPTQAQITAWGSSYPYYYLASHLVPDAGDSTITEREIDLLLLRASVEAMRELAIRNHSKPVTLGRGDGAGAGASPRNSTPAALYQALLQEFHATP